MEARGMGRALTWVLAGLLALPVLAYALLYAVNWRDEAPSADARRLQALIAQRPPVAEGDNGFVHLLGLGAPATHDPVAVGVRRREWLDSFEATDRSSAALPFPGVPDAARVALPAASRAVASACARAVPRCVDAMRADPAATAAWLQAEATLLARYRAMLGRGGWREAVPRDPRAPLPPFTLALEAQRLHLADAWRRAAAGDAAGVRSLLEADLGFWRRVLAASDQLVTKMVARGAIERHFRFGSAVLQALPAGVRGAAVPEAWHRPLSRPERSLMRALAGEWHLGAGFMDAVVEGRYAVAEPGMADRVSDALTRPLWKRQASLNRRAARMLAIGRASEAPPAQVPAALDAVYARWRREHRPLRLYDPVGHLLDGLDASLYRDYVARVAALDRQRREALAAVAPASAGTPGEER